MHPFPPYLVFVVVVAVLLCIPCRAVTYIYKKMKMCLGVDEEIHDIETGTPPTTPPQSPQTVQQKAQRVESYEIFHHRKDVEAVGFHSGDCVICLGEFEEDEECAMLKKCKHTYHRDCIDKVKEDSCPLCRHCIVDVKIEKPSKLF
ncbi:putative transcription factor C2H2 family [Rosa chinensis]|uniref:Putative transcription factor C2H2 family n=1 Tax=Rosa chinensis TaxID=74649 RepID=A0A2P6RJY5_ROSCH|nr:putative transcription factor C2H2 family [Rosa chinensis]